MIFVDTRWNLAFPPYNDLQWGVPGLNVVGVDFERSPTCCHGRVVDLFPVRTNNREIEIDRAAHARLIAIGAL
jgi:hypothetical protein